jgi:hypothetical protein
MEGHGFPTNMGCPRSGGCGIKWSMRPLVFAPSALIGLGFLGLLGARAADVEWRGGAGNSWHTVANWKLPSDLPANLTPEQAESLRRAPQAGDRALVPVGVTVQVLAGASVKGATILGGLEVLGPNGSLAVQHGAGTPPGDRFGTILVGSGGKLDLQNPAVVEGETRVAGGQLSVFRPVDFQQKVRVEAQPVGSPVSTLKGLDPGGPQLIQAGLELDGPAGSVANLAGRFRVEGGRLSWRNCSVELFPGGVGLKGEMAVGSTAEKDGELKLGGGDFQTLWRISDQSELLVDERAAVVLGPGRAAFEGRVRFGLRCRGILGAGNDDGMLSFVGGEIGIMSSEVPGDEVVVEGPVQFQGLTVVTLTHPASTDLSTVGLRLGGGSTNGGPVRSVRFGDRVRVQVDTPTRFHDVVMTDLSAVEVRHRPDQIRFGDISLLPAQGQGPGALGGPGRGRFEVLGGRLTIPDDRNLSVPERFTLVFGQEETTGGRAPEITILGRVNCSGTLLVRGGTNAESATRAVVTPRIVTFGNVEVLGGHGFGPGTQFWQLAGRVRLSPHPVGLAEGVPAVSPMGEVFMAQATVEVFEGTALGVTAGEFGDLATLQFVGKAALVVQGLSSVAAVTSPAGGDIMLGGLFHIRRGAELLGMESGLLEVVGDGVFGRNFRGGSLIDVPAGLAVERAVQFGEVVLGRRDGMSPQVRFVDAGTNPFGPPGLTVLKRLGWFGGAFVGHPAGATGTVARVVVPEGALAALARPDAGQRIGGNCTLADGVEFQVHGGLSVNVLRSVGCEGPMARFVFEPGSEVTLQQMGSRSDLTTARILNRTVVRKVGTEPVFFNGEWANEGAGMLRIEAGDVVVRHATLDGLHYETSVTGASIRVEESTLKDFEHRGGTFGLSRSSRFEGNCVVDHLTIGNGLTGEVVMTSGPDATVTVSKGVVWRSNGIQLGGNGRLVTAPGSFSRIDSVLAFTPAGFFESGTWENHGEIEVVARSGSRFQFKSAGVLDNHGTVRLDSREGDLFFGGFFNGGADGFRFINRGLLLLGAVPNGQLKVKFNAEFESVDGGRLEVEGQAPRPGRAAGPAAPNPPNLGELEFGDVTEIKGGLLDLRTVDVKFLASVSMTGGRILAGGNGDVRFEATYLFNGGELRLLKPGFGRFGRAVTIRGGRLHLDAETDLDALPGFNLSDGAVLSGLGRTRGGVTVLGSRVEPGDTNGAGEVSEIGSLRIGADISFDAASRLVLHVPVQRGATERDGLVVGGRAKLNGTVEFVPLNTGATDLLADEVSVLDYATREGDFVTEICPTFRDVHRLTRRFRDGAPLTDMAAVLVADATGGPLADLALELEAPLTAPAGASVTYRFTAVNRGPEEAPAPAVEVTVPSGTQVESVEPAGTRTGDRLRVSLGTLERDARRTVVLTLKGPAVPSALAISAEVGSDRADPAPENNRVSVTTAILTEGGFSAGRFSLKSDGTLRLALETLVGVRYRLERSTDLRVFTEVLEFVGDGAERVVEGFGTTSGPPEFFRLVIVPAG